ncbi:flagellar biosynthesis anti-sigma factor FlgM [Desulfoplanes sp.]
MDIQSITAQIDRYTNTSVAETKNAKKGGTASKTPENHPDTVSLSNRAKLLQTAGENASSAPSTRPEKIQGLKERIDSGDYSPDPEKIAAQIVKEDLDIWG